jgi:hypothetical protein
MCIILFSLVSITIPVSAEFHRVSGYLYIDDGVKAPSGVLVKLSFDYEIFTDNTNENGHYEFDFTGHEQEIGYFTVTYNDINYVPTPYSVEIDVVSVSIDLHIDITDDGNGGNGGSGGNGGGTGTGGGGGGIPMIPSTLIADAGGPYYGFIDEVITLTGSASSGTSPYSYMWDFDNNGEYLDGTGVSPTFSWSTSGEYIIKLKVTDNNGKTDTDEASVIISRLNNLPYNLIVDGSIDGIVDTTYDYTAFATDDDSGDQIKYGWDWNYDGIVDEWTDFYESEVISTINHSFSTAGFYRVRAQAEDSNNGNSGWSKRLLVFIDVNFQQQVDGRFLIDFEKDDTWDSVYNPETDILTDYEEEVEPPEEPFTKGEFNNPDNSIWYLLGIILLIIALLALLFLYNKKKEEQSGNLKK